VQTEEKNTPEFNAPNKLETIETSQPLIYPTPDNPPWNGWTAFGVWAASVFFIILFPNLFLLPYIATQNLNFSDQSQLLEFLKTDSFAIVLQIAAVIPAHILTLVLAWYIVTKFNTYSFRETLGWNWNGFKIWHSLVIFVSVYALAIILSLIFGDVENDFEKLLKNSRTAVYFVAFFATFTAPLVEEVVYRGILYSAFYRKFGVILAVLFVTLLFTVVHIPQYSSNSIPDYASVITLLLLSLTLTLIRVKTKNLLPCIILHTVFNGIQSLILIFEPFLTGVANQPENKIAAIFRFLM